MKVDRRTALRGLGTLVALPWLESLAKATPLGDVPSLAAGPPKRLAFLYVPNGVHMQDWTPKGDGKLGALPDILKSLEPFKDRLNVLSGLELDKARPNGDGPGDHARAMSAFLTGSQPRKTHGADIRVGVSADQHVANAIGDQTRFPSLELGIERGAQAGNCDSGYSCAYSSNISWRTESTPVAKEINPRLAFERLFSDDVPGEAGARRARYRRSILDFVAEDARTLQGRLGATDRRKLDEYLSSVRELERRVARSDQGARADRPEYARPTGIPKDYREHIRLMCDL